MNLIYDGSYQGLLTCLYKAHKKGNVSRIVTNNYQVDIFNQDLTIKTNNRIASKMNSYLNKKYGQEFIKDIYYANLSNSLEKATHILKFYNLARKSDYEISSVYSHPDALPVKKLSHKVGLEKHRFLGLLRFKDYRNILVAKYHPDHDITELLMTHFADRLNNFKFIIIDESRSIAGIYNQKKWFINHDFNQNFLPEDSLDDFEVLWQNYFDTTTIKSRVNHKLQRQYLPKRYLKYLPEFKK